MYLDLESYAYTDNFLGHIHLKHLVSERAPHSIVRLCAGWSHIWRTALRSHSSARIVACDKVSYKKLAVHFAILEYIVIFCYLLLFPVGASAWRGDHYADLQGGRVLY